MLNEKYKEWLTKQWTNNGGLITQAQAAKILGKTPTRIRQMINERKIKGIIFEDDTPLLSYSQIMRIYDAEEIKTREEQEANNPWAEYEKAEEEEALKQEEEELEKANPFWKEEIKAIEKERSKIKKEINSLNDAIQSLEEKRAEIENKLNKPIVF